MSELKPDSENTEERLPETAEQEKEQPAASEDEDFFYDDNEIEILKAEGIASKFSNEMQIKIVKDTLDALEKINSKNNSSNEMKPKEEKKKEPKCELAIVKEYQILEELKKMLLDQKTIENSPEESTKLKRKR